MQSIARSVAAAFRPIKSEVNFYKREVGHNIVLITLCIVQVSVFFCCYALSRFSKLAGDLWWHGMSCVQSLLCPPQSWHWICTCASAWGAWRIHTPVVCINYYYTPVNWASALTDTNSLILDINLLLYLRNRDVWDRMYQYFCIDPHVSLFVELNNAMFAHLAVTWMLHKNSLCLDNRIFLTKQPCGWQIYLFLPSNKD